MDFWCFVDVGGEGERRIKDDFLGSGWMVGVFNRLENLGEE